MRVTWTIAGAALLAAACSTGKQESATTDSAAAAAAPAPAGAAAGSDNDRATGGGGVPAGYVGRTDRDGVAISGASYVNNGGKWEVTTGPAHIVYAAKDSARGSYTASASFDQLEAPRHPEAYGIFIGGKNLDQPTQQYTYFLVRGTGEYFVKVRDGAQTKGVIDWKASDAVPKADASGKASYRLAAQVGADSVRFLVNDKPVAAVAKAGLPTDGIAGLRINHNLHVAVTPVEIKK
ncbi:MAG: hypothetical protein ACJ79S_16950 [Gemmatimonadaceae bacterium]